MTRVMRGSVPKPPTGAAAWHLLLRHRPLLRGRAPPDAQASASPLVRGPPGRPLKGPGDTCHLEILSSRLTRLPCSCRHVGGGPSRDPNPAEGTRSGGRGWPASKEPRAKRVKGLGEVGVAGGCQSWDRRAEDRRAVSADLLHSGPWGWHSLRVEGASQGTLGDVW